MGESAESLAGRLSFARVLVELGDLDEAEFEIAEILDAAQSDLGALSLFAKVKHLRGHLSQAIACWTEIHAATKHNPWVLMQLAALLHVAQDPERGALEYVAVGHGQLAPKPVAHLVLEDAFRLFLACHPDEARAKCDRLALRYRDTDRDAYKLAILANAWMFELRGDLMAACRLLEDLGKERGFGDDIDRVIALIRLYGRIGTPDKLEAAIQICNFLEGRYEKMSLLAELAGLYHRLGREAKADEYDRRYLEAFKMRMHRPTFAEITRAAGARYLPLSTLLSLKRAPAPLTDSEPPRAHAVALALAGDLSTARTRFADGGTVLDQKYLGDIAALENDEARAARTYIDALTKDPGDLRLLGWLLDHRTGPAATAIAEFFRAPAVAALTRSDFAAAIAASPLNASLWRHHAAFLSFDPEAAPEACAAAFDRAKALADAAERNAHAVGRVLAAGVYHLIGKAKGLIHQIWADREPARGRQGGWLPDDKLLGNLTPEMRHGVRNVFLSVREYARAKFPHRTRDILDYSYTFKVTKEDEPSGGLSAGVPTALAFLSVFLQWPVPQDIASTGVLVVDAHDALTVQSVAETDVKVRGAYNRNLRMIIVPRQNRSALQKSTAVPPAICDEIVRYAADFDDVVRLVYGDDAFIADV